MAQKFVLAGVGDIQLFDPNNGEIIVTSKTLTDSGINFSVTAEDIRGGQANGLIAQYFHDTAMGLTLTDALFSMEYLALNVGGEITPTADVITMEEVTVTTADTISVTGTPKNFGNVGTIGWFTIAGADNWNKITFVGKDATVSGLPVNTKVCVKYVANDASAEQFIVSSTFIPSQCYAILTLPLFKAGTESTSYTSSSKVGEVQVEIPNFLLAGAQDLALTSSGASTTALSGNALVSYTGSEGCSDSGYYAKLKQITYNKDEFADVKAIVIANSDIELDVNGTTVLEVYALYGGTKAPRLLENTHSKLVFSSGDNDKVTVVAGLVTGIASGSTDIEVAVDGTSLSAKAYVTVS